MLQLLLYFKKLWIVLKKKPNKIWVDQGSDFYNSLQKIVKRNDISMYSAHNGGKSVVAERFIITLENNIYKHMTAISKNVYFDVLDDIVDKYNNTYHKTIKMKPIDVKDNSFTEYSEELKRKVINYMLNVKDMIILLTVGLIRKTYYK